MNQDLTITLTPMMLACVPAVAGILQGLKEVKPLARLTDYFSIFSMILGVLLLLLTQPPSLSLILPGIVVGQMATASYEALKDWGKTPNLMIGGASK